jgi:tetratricopeptide (TPR) repeat protein
MADALTEFWFLKGHGVEGVDTLRAQLERPEAQEPGLLRGRALASAGRLIEYYLADYATAVALAGQALDIARANDDEALAVRALSVMAEALNRQGDYRGCLSLVDEALPVARKLGDPRPAAIILNHKGCALDGIGEDGRASFEESAALCRLSGDRRGAAAGFGNIGVAALYAGDLEAASQRFAEAVEVFEALGERRGLALCTLNAGFVEYLKGDQKAACQRFREGLDTARRIGARPLVAYAILGRALSATASGDVRRAATMHGVFDAIFNELGAAVEPLEARLRDDDHARLRTRVGDDAFDDAYNQGRAMPVDDALVLGNDPTAPLATGGPMIPTR